MSSDETAIAHRVVRLLRGRPHHKWAAWVGLSGGTVSRLMKGALPDPVKLSGAIRAENLSLSWLVDGIGSPYLAVNCGTQERMQSEINLMMGDEDSLQAMLVVGARDLHVVVLHQRAQIEVPGQVSLVNYTAVTILSAAASEPLRIDRNAKRWSTLHQDTVMATAIATGFVSSSELFGWPGEPIGMADERQPMDVRYNKSMPIEAINAYAGAVRDLSPNYGDTHSLIDRINQLPPEDRAMVMSLVARLDGGG